MTVSSTASIEPSASEHPIRNRQFRRWLLGSAISLLGDQFYMAALPWLVLLHLGSARTLGMIMMAGAVPRAVLILFGGATVDRISARQIILTTSAARAACVAAIGVLAARGTLTVWEIYGLVVAFGIADAFAMPAQLAYIPSLLKREQLVAGSSLAQIVTQLAAILGPLPAGLLIAARGVSAAFLVDAVSFLFVIAALLRLPDPQLIVQRSSALGAIADGIAHVVRDGTMRTLMLLATAMTFCITGPVTIGIADLAKSRFDSSVYGVMVSALAAGGFVGSLSGVTWKVRRPGTLILVGTALLGVLLFVIPFAPGMWSITTVLLLMGAAAGLVNVHTRARVMAQIDVAVRGRASSVFLLASLGTLPISMAVAGLVATWSQSGLFVLAGAATVVVAAAAAAGPSVRDMEP